MHNIQCKQNLFVCGFLATFWLFTYFKGVFYFIYVVKFMLPESSLRVYGTATFLKLNIVWFIVISAWMGNWLEILSAILSSMMGGCNKFLQLLRNFKALRHPFICICASLRFWAVGNICLGLSIFTCECNAYHILDVHCNMYNLVRVV